MEILKREGFVQGRVTSAPPQPAPRYYAMQDGAPIPPHFGPEELKKAIASGEVVEVAAPVAPAPIVQSSPATERPLSVGTPMNSVPVEPFSHDGFAERRAQAQKEFDDKLAKIAAEQVPVSDSITAEEALEDLVWALRNEGAYLVDASTGHPVTQLSIGRS